MLCWRTREQCSRFVPKFEFVRTMPCAAGTAEQAGFFCTTGKKARNQQTKYECTRVKLDRFMVGALLQCCCKMLSRACLSSAKNVEQQHATDKKLEADCSRQTK